MKGCLRILSFATSSQVFIKAGYLYVRSGETLAKFKVEAARSGKSCTILKLEGIEDRDQAEALKGKELLVEKKALTKGEGEYFWFELVGLKVLDRGERPLGEVKEVMGTLAHDILVVSDGKKVSYVPFVEGIVEEIQLEKGYIVVNPPEGLLELD